MSNSSFWLIHADNSYVTVGLCQVVDNRPNLTSIGQPFPWTTLEPDSFITAVDESLSQASSAIELPPEQEPTSSAFVVSPLWLDPEGKIIGSYLKLIETVCKKLDLKPLGFIPNDEAILESSTNNEGLPSSFVLVHLSPTNFDLSLIYLGKIKERVHHELTGSFLPSDLETVLSSLHTDSTLPPQIIIFGHFTPSIIDSIKNYTWIGKKNVETFLHFPDVVTYSQNDVFSIFLKVISTQFKLQVSDFKTPVVSPTPVEPTIAVEELTVVDPESLDFTPAVIRKDPDFSSPIEQPTFSSKIPDYSSDPPKEALKLPKIKLPPIRLSLNIPIIILVLSPLIFLGLFLLLKVEISLVLTPFDFVSQKNVTLDYSDNPSATSIPVKIKSVDTNIVANIAVTGQKTTGEKAIGEVTIYNQFGSNLNLSKGTTLTSESGLKFQLDANVQVAGSSANYDTGIITMGQTRANIVASDIGEEYNLGKDQKLYIKESGGAQVLTKVKENLTGGVKRLVQVISTADKAEVDRQVDQKVNSPGSSSITEITNTPGILANTIISKKQRIEYSRQIGEEVDVLEASAKNTVSAYYLDDIDKSTLINRFFGSDPNLAASSYSVSNFTFNFTPDKSSVDKTKGLLSIKGSATPKLDLTKLSSLLVGKTTSQAKKTIFSFSSRINDYTTTPKLPILPLLKSNINIKIQ